MENSKSFANAVREALSKKQSAAHPDSKTTGRQTVKRITPPAPQGKPVRKAAGRGG
jgi:hypothetical protein